MADTLTDSTLAIVPILPYGRRTRARAFSTTETAPAIFHGSHSYTEKG